MDKEDKNSIFLTCKNYFTEKGVATQLNNQEVDKKPETWFVKGPMGMGLDFKNNGHNIVFTGGTGILVFLDLVAKLVLKYASFEDFEKSEKLDISTHGEDRQQSQSFGKSFRLTIYYTAPSEEEAIGI